MVLDRMRESVTAEAGSEWHRAAQVGPVIQAAVIGVAIILMILIYDQVQGVAQPLVGGTEGDPVNNTAIQNAGFNATDTFSSSMELAPVIVLVLIASVVIAIVQRFR